MFNPVSLYYCFDRGGERSSAGRRGGDQHAVGRAPHLRAATAAAALRWTRASTSRRSWAWRRLRAAASRSPARRSRCTSRAPRGGRRRSTPRSRCSAASCSRRAAPALSAPPCAWWPDLRAGRAAEAEGRPLPPAPGAMIAARARSSGRPGRASRRGRLEVVEGGRRRSFGPPDADLRATIDVHDPRASGARSSRGSAGLAEVVPATASGTATTWSAWCGSAPARCPALDRVRRAAAARSSRPSRAWPRNTRARVAPARRPPTTTSATTCSTPSSTRR